MNDEKFPHQPPLLEEVRACDAEGLKGLYTRLLERMAALDPVLRVFANGPPDADQVLEECGRIAGRWKNPAVRPPLFGLPVGVKEIIRIAGRPLRCGSLLPADLFAGEEAALVTRLRAAGAVILDYTVSTEFAYAEAGPTCNPHDPAHTPGGSSSGSAAGVAAGFFSIGLGTQTVGSIIRPASYCGVAGFKPSFDRLPMSGIIHFSPSVDHVGLLGVNPRELAAVMAAVDPDWRSAPPPLSLRLALPVGPYLSCALPETVSRLRTKAEALAARLEQAGRSIDLVEVPCFEDMDVLRARHELLIAAEAAEVHRPWFKRYEHMYRPRTRDLLRGGLAVKPAELEAARASRFELRERLHRLMIEHGADFWISPSALGEADPGLHGTGNPIMNLPWTHAGLPALNLPPCRGARGLPLGLQLVGAFERDEEVLAVGALLWEA